MSEVEATGGATAGAQLRAAREASGLGLAAIAAQTRVPQRHLESIERDDFTALPSPTYTVGFARAFARVVGADEVAVAAAIRAQLEHGGRVRQEYQAFEPADPARVPPRALAWTAAIVAVLVLAGYALWRNLDSEEGKFVPVATASSPAAPSPTSGPAPSPTLADGPIVLTATDAVWIKITDSSGQSLVQKEMKAGESFQIPAGAQDPKLTFSRPEAVTVTVGGIAVPALGPPAKLVKDALLTSDALRARMTGSPSPTPAVSPQAGSDPARATR
jgi:cytoskeletal protein RodZ